MHALKMHNLSTNNQVSKYMQLTTYLALNIVMQDNFFKIKASESHAVISCDDALATNILHEALIL